MKAKLVNPPNTQRAVDRCTVLFDAATDLFIQYGYDQVSLDQIVERAGGSKATIYKYFGSKQGLFLAICRDRSDKFIYQIELACQKDSDDIRANLTALLQDLYSIFTDENNMSFDRLLISISAEHQELAIELYNQGPQQSYNLLAAYLEKMHLAGLLDCPRPLDSAVTFFGFFQDLHWRTLIGLPIDNKDDAQIAYFVDRFIRGHQHCHPDSK